MSLHQVLPVTEAHLAKAQTILGEAILPEKVDIVLAANEFDQTISRAAALKLIFLESGSIAFF
jgi:hypothetical protein